MKSILSFQINKTNAPCSTEELLFSPSSYTAPAARVEVQHRWSQFLILSQNKPYSKINGQYPIQEACAISFLCCTGLSLAK
jgi:hypothetical protein